MFCRAGLSFSTKFDEDGTDLTAICFFDRIYFFISLFIVFLSGSKSIILINTSLFIIIFLLFLAASKKAQMAKLVDALVSGTSVSNDVQVRVLFWAPRMPVSCPDGEIGRHASLRGWCRLRCASSSLVLGT
jgi:hypothetical protein